jgi:hypothetical protein
VPERSSLCNQGKTSTGKAERGAKFDPRCAICGSPGRLLAANPRTSRGLSLLSHDCIEGVRAIRYKRVTEQGEMKREGAMPTIWMKT